MIKIYHQRQNHSNNRSYKKTVDNLCLLHDYYYTFYHQFQINLCRLNFLIYLIFFSKNKMFGNETVSLPFN